MIYCKYLHIFIGIVKQVIVKIQWYTPVQYTFGTIITTDAPTIVIKQNTEQQFKYIVCKWANSDDNCQDSDDEEVRSVNYYSFIQLKSIYHPILQLPLEDVVPSRPTTHNKFMLLDCCYFVNKLYNYGYENITD